MKTSIINWLLEKENPSVRYNTLTLLLKKSQEDIEVINAKKSIMETGAVVKILNKQNEDGSWDDPIRFYRAKY
ncbi:MAG: nitrogen fixation protein NifH, partial [Tenericutes bacterium]|nr:nitrogen fixation protein NifH [Mycoplasmatota bacterium]